MTGARRGRSWVLVISYLPLLGLAALLLGKPSREERWHARNGLLLTAVFLAVLTLAILAGVWVPSLGCVSGFLVFVLAVVYPIVMSLAIVKAVQGERLMFRGLSKYADRD
jgi:uncharacterized membrane protein